MSTSIIQSTSIIFSHSDFINEISSLESDDDCFIGKRKPLTSCSSEGQTRLKVLVLDQQTTKTADSDNALLSLEKTDSDNSSDEGSQFSCENEIHNNQNSTYSHLLKDQTNCYKMLLKHFLSETIMNEKCNLQRFNYLPKTCQNLVLIFLNQNFGFDLEDELKKGSPRRYLFNLQRKNYQTTKQCSVSLSFLTDCYIYGVVKQLQQNGKLVSRNLAIKTLHNKLVQSGVSVQAEDFTSSIESLLKYKEEEITDPSKEISDTLISKMSQIPEATLTKFYSVRLHQALSELIDSCSTVDQLESTFKQPQLDIDILSAYMGKASSKPANYSSTLLTIV